MQEQLIYDIENVEVGDIAYYEGSEKGARVTIIDPNGYGNRLKIKVPEELKPFKLWSGTSVWLQDSYFQHAIRPTQNKPVEKRLPAMQEGHEHIFETQEGVRIIYDGAKYRGWRIESFLDDKRLLELLDPSQFPLKDMMEEEA